MSTSSAAQQLECFRKVLADTEGTTFLGLPGVPVKNIAILPSTLSGADVICVALRGGSYDQPLITTRTQRTLMPVDLAMLHMCCANYDGGAKQARHDSQVAKLGAQFQQSKRKCFAAERYKQLAVQHDNEEYVVIPVLFEMPQKKGLKRSAEEKDYLLVADLQNWQHIFTCETKDLETTRGQLGKSPHGE